MRYPIRSVIFKPFLRLGITDEDWGLSIIFAVAVFFVLMLLDFKTSLPLPLIGGILTLAALVAVFRFIRDGKPNRWLEHQLETFGRSKTKAAVNNDHYRQTWLKSHED